MNIYSLIAGAIALILAMGHLVFGKKRFLQPILKASADLMAKTAIHAMYYYLAVFYILSAVVLMAKGLGCPLCSQHDLLDRFIAVNFILFAVVQLVVFLRSKVEKAYLKCYQWVIFSLIAIFALLGSSVQNCMVK